jgi:hypothetical protein
VQRYVKIHRNHALCRPFFSSFSLFLGITATIKAKKGFWLCSVLVYLYAQNGRFLLCNWSAIELERNTVSKFITSQIAEATLYEADKNITASPETALAF